MLFTSKNVAPENSMHEVTNKSRTTKTYKRTTTTRYLEVRLVKLAVPLYLFNGHPTLSCHRIIHYTQIINITQT